MAEEPGKIDGEELSAAAEEADAAVAEGDVEGHAEEVTDQEAGYTDTNFGCSESF
ncbi:hypothetical protein [Streptomyces sp. NBC_01190]|uniref:hypothetical protein n=1 Tax=Streptomyces sp. NBC_01190 TaxID=2903767 RepID=UPI00386D92E9|nr:hypothetical protein OG519_13180 [Streptomyces sp. NBC_01190]